jgi:hypothetical protein
VLVDVRVGLQEALKFFLEIIVLTSLILDDRKPFFENSSLIFSQHFDLI